jgi:hypothetical protein
VAIKPHLSLSYWSQISQEDQIEFLQLLKERIRTPSLQRELLLLLFSFECRANGTKARAVLAGICFVR